MMKHNDNLIVQLASQPDKIRPLLRRYNGHRDFGASPDLCSIFTSRLEALVTEYTSPVSSARLRRRFDEDSLALISLLDAASVELLQNAKVPVSALSTGHVPLDMDVFPMDNSGINKEGVSYTYKGHDGYAPIAAYLGLEGWGMACEPRLAS